MATLASASMAADPFDDTLPANAEREVRFVDALVTVMVALWLELERIADRCDRARSSDDLQVVRLELELLESTARRLNRVGVLAVPDAQCVTALVDGLRRLLDPHPVATNELVEKAQDFLFERIREHAASRPPSSRAPVVSDGLVAPLHSAGDARWN